MANSCGTSEPAQSARQMERKSSASSLKPTNQIVTTLVSHRNYKQWCIIALVVFLVWFGAIEVARRTLPDYACNLQVPYSPWTRECNIATAGALCAATILQINRVSLSTFREENDLGTLSSYYASIIVHLISTIAHVGSLFFDWGGTCRDSFGVLTPAVIWPEWSTSVPLLIFIIVSIDDKPYLTYDDVFAVISLHLCIVCGALLQYTSSSIISTGLLVFSCLFFIPCISLVWKSSRELNAVLKMSIESEAKRGAFQRRILLASRKATLSMCVGLLFPVFPCLYFLRLQGLIGDDLFLVLMMFASGFTKLCFASLCMDAHLEVSHPAFALIDAENFANTSRRAFLRFVFHEVRVPLNSISMGVQVLESSPLPTEDQETVSMMKEAVNVMGETLNDVMALQKVEEGSLELYYKPFSISDLFQNVEDSFLESSVEHGVILSTDIDSRVPDRIIGDKFRLRHVLANLVSNALKYSYSGGHVQLRATIDDTAVNPTDYASLPTYETASFLTIVFSVADEGKGISLDDQEEDIFQPYRLLKPGELKAGRGTGLGLAICKEIVRMHHGQIWYTSKESVGSVFYVAIPFEVSGTTTKTRRNSSWRRRIQPDGTRRRLSTKMLSHWNVMMATPSQQDVQCSTPSPGGLTSSSNSFASHRSKRALSSSDEEVLVHPALDGCDLFDVSHLTGRAVRELSGGSFSVQSSTKSTSSSTPSTDRKPSYRQQRSDSAKSLELSDTDVANIQRYDGDNDDVFGTSDDPVTPSHDAWVTSSASSDGTLLRSTSSSEKTDGGSGNEATSSMMTRLPPTSPFSGTEMASSSSEATSNISGPLTPARSWARKPPRASPSGNNVLSSSGGPRLSVSFRGIDTIVPDIDSPRRPPPPTTSSLLGPLPQVDEGPSPTDQTPSPRPPSPSSSPTQPSTSQLSPSPPPPPPPPPFDSPSDRMGTTDETMKTTVLHSLNRQGVASISTPPSSPSASRSSYYNILIVDDVLSNRKLLALLLNKRGIHSITFAADGVAGVDTVKDKGVDAFDLIFMDNTMPHMSGIEASRVIRKLGYDNLIIGVTGNSMEDELNDFLRAGADFAITKPMKPNVLDILLQYLNTFGCRSHPNERLVIRNTSLEWVRMDSHGRPQADRHIASLK